MRWQFGIIGQLISIVTIPVVAGIVLLIAICIWTATYKINSSFKQVMDKNQAGLSKLLVNNGHGLMGTAAAVASDARIMQGLSSKVGERDAIKSFMVELYNNIKAGNSTVQSVEITDAAGVIVARGHAPEKFGDDKSGLELFANAIRSKTPQMGMGLSLRARSLTLDAVHPVMKGGTLLGLVKVGSYPSRDFLVQLKNVMGVDIAIIDSTNGKAINATLDDIGSVIDKISARMTNVKLGGVEYEAARYPLSFGGKSVAGGEVIFFTRTDVLTGITNSIAMNMLLAGTVLLIAIILTVTIFMQRKLRPLKILSNSVKSFSADNLDVRVQVTTDDEIGELGTNFNQMAEVIQEYSTGLELEVAERTRELKEKNDNIMESISYAERLQRAILPPLPHRLGISDDKCFVIWKPKDVVGGDMYWCRSDERYALIAVADCTGHGVPGALMTMALGSILDGLPRVLDGQKPSMLLYSIHNSLKETLRQEHADSLADDGADVALCMLDKKDKIFLFAGAKLSLFLEKDGIITEYKGSRHSVGYSQRKDVSFEDRLIDWVDGSVAYLTTDGLLHQHCEEGKGGLGRTGFVNLLQRIAGSPFAEQEKVVEQFIAERVKHVEQRDDITVVSFEIGKSLEGRIGI